MGTCTCFTLKLDFSNKLWLLDVLYEKALSILLSHFCCSSVSNLFIFVYRMRDQLRLVCCYIGCRKLRLWIEEQNMKDKRKVKGRPIYIYEKKFWISMIIYENFNQKCGGT